MEQLVCNLLIACLDQKYIKMTEMLCLLSNKSLVSILVKTILQNNYLSPEKVSTILKSTQRSKNNLFWYKFAEIMKKQKQNSDLQLYWLPGM